MRQRKNNRILSIIMGVIMLSVMTGCGDVDKNDYANFKADTEERVTYLESKYKELESKYEELKIALEETSEAETETESITEEGTEETTENVTAIEGETVSEESLETADGATEIKIAIMDGEGNIVPLPTSSDIMNAQENYKEIAGAAVYGASVPVTITLNGNGKIEDILFTGVSPMKSIMESATNVDNVFTVPVDFYSNMTCTIVVKCSDKTYYTSFRPMVDPSLLTDPIG